MRRCTLLASLCLLLASCSDPPERTPRTSESFSTSTSPSGGDPVVAAAGDIACDPDSSAFNDGNGTRRSCRQRFTAGLLEAGGFAAVLTLGDNQYELASLSDYEASYARSWGRLLRITYPAPGNHEYSTPRAAGYYAYFGDRAGNPARGYYSFDIGAWHLIALNSNCGAVGGCGAGSPQVEWLRADLAAHANVCALAFWHHPRFSSGLHGNDETYDAFWRALYAARADVVLVGHDHDYERFGPQDPDARADPDRGIRQFVVGTGGRSLYPFRSVRPNSEVRSNTAFGVLSLTLHPNGYDWRFVAEAGATFSDTGSGTCH